MQPSEELALEVIMFIFIGCSFLACVGCTSAILSKYYNQYIMNLPSSLNEPITDNAFDQYPRASVTVHNCLPVIEVAKVVLPKIPDDIETDTIAVAIEVCD